MKNIATIEALERRLVSLERKANATIEIINDLRSEDGLPPRSPLSGGGGGFHAEAPNGSATMTQIKPDSFYGKKLQTAVREYLELRKATGQSATPREIYTAITNGGYQFDTKDEHTALVGLRALLRKRTGFFHRLPNGTYGLTSWYEHTKRPRAAESVDEDSNEDESVTEDKANQHNDKEATTKPKADAAS
jgi:hypothetical protein